MDKHVFLPGEFALVRGSIEVVEVVAQVGENVLIKRAGGQIATPASRLCPYSDACPLQ